MPACAKRGTGPDEAALSQPKATKSLRPNPAIANGQAKSSSPMGKMSQEMTTQGSKC